MKVNVVIYKDKLIIKNVEITDKNYYIAKENQKYVYSKIIKRLKELKEKGIIKSIRIIKTKKLNPELRKEIELLIHCKGIIKQTLRQLYDFFE